VLASPPKIKPVSTVGTLETVYRASLAFVRSHPLGLIWGILFVVMFAALWRRGRMNRKFGPGLTPTFSLHEKFWSEGNGPDRQSSGKTASMGKFD
jgi:hypothetical protein